MAIIYMHEPYIHYGFKSGPETAVHRLDVAVYHLCRPLRDIMVYNYLIASVLSSFR